MELNDHTNGVLASLLYTNILLLCAVVLALVAAGYGQTGEPLTQTSGLPALPSPLVLDATRFTGVDACAQISAAITQMMSTTNNGVVDARGFTGHQKCASNMFGISNPKGKLLLGNTTFHVQTPQVQPDRFQVEGVGWSPGSTGNTLILACNGDSHCSANLPTPGALWCWGAGGNCSSLTNNGLSFGSLTQYVTFDCAGLSGCTAMQAFWVQEGSGCWHCQFRGWYNSNGVGLDVCGGSANLGSCQNSSFFDLYATIGTASPAPCRANAVPIRVNSGGTAGPKFIRQVTVNATNCSTLLPNQAPYDSLRSQRTREGQGTRLLCIGKAWASPLTRFTASVA
jgi:hypothetical protein